MHYAIKQPILQTNEHRSETNAYSEKGSAIADIFDPENKTEC